MDSGAATRVRVSVRQKRFEDRSLISFTDDSVVMATPNLGARAPDVLELSTPLAGLRDAHRAKLAPSPDPERILRSWRIEVRALTRSLRAMSGVAS